MNKLNALFTYGTLQPGEEADHYLKQISGTWHDAYVLGKYISDSKIGYPAIQLNAKGKKIKGKLFYSIELSKIIKNIDAYEGDEYKRSIANVYLTNGSMQSAYVYELK